MARILYQINETTWNLYTCPHSKRLEFDLIEAAYKCRWLTQNRKALQATAVENDEIKAHWKWNEHQQNAQRLVGPEL